MKRILFLGLLLFSILLNSQDSLSLNDNKNISNYNQDGNIISSDVKNEELTAQIFFYRLPNYFGSAIKMKILVNDNPIVRISNNSQFKLILKPGVYRFSCKMADSSVLKLKIESGKTYYIKCSINPGFWSGFPVLEMVDTISGGAVISGGSLRKLDYKSISNIKPKSRLGLYFGGGFGFEDIPMGTTDNEEDLTLSTGGGYLIGAEYGYGLYKHLDLSISCFYQGSTMTPPVDNYDASYDRMGIVLTPSLILPLKGGYFNFKLGSGIGYYSLCKMTINASNAGSGDFILNYKSTIGFHSSLIFESHFSDKGSFTFGLKYYNVQYEYKKDGSTGSSNESIILKPNGNGLDFLFGYYFHF